MPSNNTDEPYESLRLALAETFAFYFKAHSFHWNVRGPMFVTLHAFFGDIYADAHSATDMIAEHIRTIDRMAPTTIDDITRDCKIKFVRMPQNAMNMVAQLETDNRIVLDALQEACLEASAAKNQGLANFLQDRLDKHADWSWRLKALRFE